MSYTQNSSSKIPKYIDCAEDDTSKFIIQELENIFAPGTLIEE